MKSFIRKPRFFPFRFKKKNEIPENRRPKVRTKTLPGPRSQKLIESLKRFEAPGVTFIGDVYPVFFKKASGCNIVDVDGNRFLDLTSCFAVSSLGHSSKALNEAIRRQARLMVHGMGDMHPNEVKIELAKKLSEITPGNLNQTLFSSTGSEAVESALKTAVMHTKKPGVLSFTGAYHGLSYGTLAVTHREDFKKPFAKQIGAFSYCAPFPDTRTEGNKASQMSLRSVRSLVKKARRSKAPVGAVILEPIQGRGGIMQAPQDFLKELRVLCDEEKIVFIADEVFTGFGRTGSMFAMDKSAVVPDLLCVGKGMGGGFPISACVGTTRVMYSWGQSTGEAVHTSTFLGNPLGCAVALAVIREIEQKRLVDRSKAMGDLFRKELWKLKEKYPLIADVRGAGLMIGIELAETAPRARKAVPATAKAKAFSAEALRQGIIVLLAGPSQNIISITPPFVISEKDITFCAKVFDGIFQKVR